MEAEERTASGWVLGWLEDLLKDLQFGTRLLLKQRGFTVVAVLTLAVGIGANTAIFSAANAILFRPLPFPEPNQLIAINETDPQGHATQASAGDFMAWRAQMHSLESLALVVDTRHLSLIEAGEPVSVVAQAVSTNYIATLGVRPELGRNFLPTEEPRVNANAVVLSHGFWMREFGGRLDIINHTIELNGTLATIVGVLPESFSFAPGEVDLWVPVGLNPQNHAARYINQVVGRLRSGGTIAQARSEMALVADRLAKQYPTTNKGFGTKIEPLLEDYVGDVRLLMLALLAAVGFLLLICCANIANLLLARTLARRREIVIRITLGARRGRIVRQFLAESLLLALLGGGCGVLVADWGVRLLVDFAPALPRMNEVAIDGRALIFTLGLTLFTGIAFGLVPALHAARLDLNDALKSGARGSTGGGQRARRLLVVSEIALALVLLVGAGLFARSLIQLQRIDPGFQPRGAVIAKVVLPRKNYPYSTEIAAFAERTIAALSVLPQVQAVGATVWMPLLDGGKLQSFALSGWTITDPTALPQAMTTSVSAGYGRAMGLPLLRGRFFTDHDVQNSPNVALINEALARRYFAGTDPIGRRIGIMAGGSQPDHWDEIVGIVGNAKILSLKDDKNQPEAYEALAQRAQPTLTFVIRTQGSQAGLPAAIRAAIQSVDKTQPVATMDSLPGLVAKSHSSLDFTVFLFAVFSVVALGLAAIGIYGVMAYSVAQRTNEIGVRMALGACRGDVLQLVLGQGGRLIGVGLLVGLVGALVLSQFLQSLLFGVSSYDPTTFTVIALLLAFVAVIACLVPAWRATRIEPMIALRCE